MENTFERELIHQQAKADLRVRLKTMGTIGVFWFLLIRILTLWTDGVTTWGLIDDSITAATALYLPYRVGEHVTGTTLGGAVGAFGILLWMSTWIGDHELLGWMVIISGYLIDFGPCVYRLLVSWSH